MGFKKRIFSHSLVLGFGAIRPIDQKITHALCTEASPSSPTVNRPRHR